MCGIAGIVRLAPEAAGAREEARERVAAMAGRLAHRGPDRQGTWVSPEGRCALGHARLEVIDLDTGDQPMASWDDTLAITYNGEIYNFLALRTELERAGHVFRTRSDTEVLVHGYREWGDDLVEHIDGMFAFGLWDVARSRLLLARDRVGKKPLFVYRDGARLAFASEMKAFHCLPDFDDTLDPAFVPTYLAYGYMPSPATPYRSVRKVEPGTRLVLDEVGERQERYWSVHFRSGRVRDPKAKVRTLLREAVERRLVSDVPLGAFLSGGIDSTLVVGMMSQLREAPVETFSIGFADDANYDETDFARRVSKRFGTRHHEFRVEAGSLELLDTLLDAYDEPFGDSSALPTWTVSRLTRKHVTVALTGDGGDELFAGYPRFLGAVWAERLPRPLLALGAGMAGLLPHDPNFRSLPRRARRFLAAARLPAPERMLRWIGYWPDAFDTWLTPAARGAVGSLDVLEPFAEPWRRSAGESALARVLSLNFHTYLLDDLLVKADRCSMAHGLELRSPFLDTALVEFAAGLPDRWRTRRGSLKILLKRAFPDLLPDWVASRPKMGFGIPLPTWFRTHWRGEAESALLSPRARILQWVRPEPIRAAFRAHQEGSADYGHGLWALLVLERWLSRARFRASLD